MNVQSFLHTVDGISTWVGKALAWLIIVLMVRGLRRGVQALHPEHADGVDLRRQQHALRHAVHDVPAPTRWRRTATCAATSSTARCGRARRPRSTSCSTSCSSCPASRALIYAGYDYARRFLAHRRAFQRHRDGPPVYQFKTVIPIAGALVMLQGIAEIVRCVVCLQDRRVAEPR